MDAAAHPRIRRAIPAGADHGSMIFFSERGARFVEAIRLLSLAQGRDKGASWDLAHGHAKVEPFSRKRDVSLHHAPRLGLNKGL
eukprot:6193656-Prymnesium_polylepis.1